KKEGSNQQELDRAIMWKKCPLQVGSTECGYYVMRYLREIVTRGSIVISDA
ncbi:hypothetical protein Csa_017015, partial [Cucumis sativus]